MDMSTMFVLTHVHCTLCKSRFCWSAFTILALDRRPVSLEQHRESIRQNGWIIVYFTILHITTWLGPVGSLSLALHAYLQMKCECTIKVIKDNFAVANSLIYFHFCSLQQNQQAGFFTVDVMCCWNHVHRIVLFLLYNAPILFAHRTILCQQAKRGKRRKKSQKSKLFWSLLPNGAGSIVAPIYWRRSNFFHSLHSSTSLSPSSNYFSLSPCIFIFFSLIISMFLASPFLSPIFI